MIRIYHIIIIIFVFVGFKQTWAQSDTSRVKKEVYKKRVIISRDGRQIYDTTVVIEGNSQTFLDTLNKYFFSMERDKNVYRSMWDGFDLGLNIENKGMKEMKLAEGTDYLKNDIGKSFNWKINMFENTFSNDKKRTGFITGLGYEHSSYRLDNKYVLLYVDQSTHKLVPVFDSSLQYSKNRIINHSLNVPVMVRFTVGSKKISPENAFQIAVGIIGTWRFASKQNIEYTKDGIEYYINRWSSLNQSTFNVKASIRMAYKFIRIWAETSLMPVLNSNQASNLYITSVGVSLIH